MEAQEGVVNENALPEFRAIRDICILTGGQAGRHIIDEMIGRDELWTVAIETKEIQFEPRYIDGLVNGSVSGLMAALHAGHLSVPEDELDVWRAHVEANPALVDAFAECIHVHVLIGMLIRILTNIECIDGSSNIVYRDLPDIADAFCSENREDIGTDGWGKYFISVLSALAQLLRDQFVEFDTRLNMRVYEILKRPLIS
jgi:hypothetical protein